MSLPDDPAQVLTRVADRTAAYPYKVWGFGEAIAMLGLLAAARVTGAHRHRAFVETLFDRWWTARAGILSFADHVTPGVPLLCLARTEPCWGRAALALGTLFRSFPTRAGIPVHRPDLAPWASHIWVDCLYTDGAFLALLARATGDASWLEVACSQAEAYVRVLWDESRGLFVHGYDAVSGRSNAVHWGRGNGWALLGLLDLLCVLRRTHPAWKRLAGVVRRHVDTLVTLQDASGHWHTVLDRPDTYLETSVAAMMAYALPVAARLGLAPAPAERAGDRAFAAAMASVDASGALTGVSEATPAGALDLYAARPTGVFPWGQGPLLLAIAERLRPDCVWEGLA
ncbi:MAG: glycoside hydrolase family 88 protein [Armatimonadota bacterium]|nr:glycoside hydrolase family 88 protein [Armatimonadota bacterium]